jgi:micrococcal nuclease
MQHTLVLAVVAGLIAVLNGWMADVFSPAFRVPESVATDVTEKILQATIREEGAVLLATTARTMRVIDGDTIEVEFFGGELALVRYIGIDSPERARDTTPEECFYTEATKRNEDLVAGQEVQLVKDVSETDQYGRLLRYVYVGEVFVNERLVREGYAVAGTFPPDVAHTDELRAAEAAARTEGAGLWSRCAL